MAGHWHRPITPLSVAPVRLATAYARGQPPRRPYNLRIVVKAIDTLHLGGCFAM
jgi:hypothetical protein